MGRRVCAADQANTSRSTRLSARQTERLRRLLVGSDSRELQLELALWTRELVADLIHRKFETKLSLVTISRMLHQMRVTPQRPVYRAWQAGPEAVEAWMTTTYSGIVAAASPAGVPARKTN